MFAKPVMEGQIHSALRYMNEEDCGGVLPLSEQVMEQLADKHPEAQKAKLGSVLFRPVEDVPAILYQQINGEIAREAALTGADLGGGCRGCAPPLPRDDLRFSNTTGILPPQKNYVVYWCWSRARDECTPS